MSTTKKKKYPGESDQAYPEVFTVAPPGFGEKKPGQFTDEQLKQFFEEGYVLVEDFLKPEELDPVKKDTEILVDQLANRLYNGGKIKKLYRDQGLFKRLISLENDFPGANILLHKLGSLPQSYRDLWSNERLLNVAEQLLGTENILGHPVWNLRTKTPKNEATTVPWHQDSAYLDNDSYNVMQLTAWIPLLDTDENNGCMQMMSRGHRTGKIAPHQCCHADTWYVMLSEEEMRNTLGVDTDEDMVTIPVPYGGAVFFNNLIPHRSLNNISDKIRWSLDLRWQRADKPVGFYGLKQGIQLRSSDPNFSIDWDPFDSVNRHDDPTQKKYDFDTTIHGPWMRKWDMVHENRHTASLNQAGTDWHSA